MLEKFKEDMPLKEPLYRTDKDILGSVFLAICNQYGQHIVYPQSPSAKHKLLYLGYRIDFGETAT